MTNEAIVAAAVKMENTHDLLNVLNKIKMSELGDRGYPFIMRHLNYFIHPSRNKNSYRTFHIPKKSGGVREISAPRLLLKSFLTYTNKLLQAFYVAPGYVTGFVPERSLVDNAEMHIGRNYIFNIDLKDFFPSISKSRVWATLKLPPFNFNDTIADAIAGLCCTEMECDGETRRALPQGSPCSPILTNIVCRSMDRKLHGLAKRYGLHYSRYADDITFSGDRNVFGKDGEFRKGLEGIISSQHFTINEKKTRLQTKKERQEVTGLVVSDRVNVTREYVRGLDNLLYVWEKYGDEDAYARFLRHYVPKQNNYIGNPAMRMVLQGKLNYLKMVKGADSEVWRRLQRRFNHLTGTKSDTVDWTVRCKYTIADFEKKIGRKLDFGWTRMGSLQCSFTLNGNKILVQFSNYSATRIGNLLIAGDFGMLERIKKNYLILFYEHEDGFGHWKIERGRRKKEE